MQDYLKCKCSAIHKKISRADHHSFSHGSSFYLWTSGTLGWSPVQAYVYKGKTPLGPFNASLGHGWHAYTKDTSGAYTIRAGYLPAGNDFTKEPLNTTIDAAKALCTRSPACRGFTFRAFSSSPPSTEKIKVSYAITNLLPRILTRSFVYI